jgi:hypothetical protein
MSVIRDIDRTRTIFRAETLNLQDWASRKPCIEELTVDCEALLIRTMLRQPDTGLKFFLEGDFEDYRALPPKFTFSSEPWNRSNASRDYPKQKENPFGGGSVFHPAPCICVHFNRNAYKEHGGPHTDWGGPERWLQAVAGEKYVRATSIAEMMSVIYVRFADTRGRLSGP